LPFPKPENSSWQGFHKATSRLREPHFSRRASLHVFLRSIQPASYGERLTLLLTCAACSVEPEHFPVAKGGHMNFLIWLVIGGLIGAIASLVMKAETQPVKAQDLVAGMLGALIGGWLLAPLFGIGTISHGDFSISSLFVSFLGALLLLMAINFYRTRRTH
jgi:uncharacterized membrane protein YeaQ/YmgE (transglycosylase-associated protein family)